MPFTTASALADSIFTCSRNESLLSRKILSHLMAFGAVTVTGRPYTVVTRGGEELYDFLLEKCWILRGSVRMGATSIL